MSRASQALFGWLPERPLHRWLAVSLLALLLLERLGLVFGQPDLLHDLDPGELKHMTLALSGLPDGDSLQQQLHLFLTGPENIHHGGFPMVSLAFWGLSQLFGASLQVLRLVPVLSTVLAAALLAAWLKRRSGPTAVLLALVLLVGAPPLFLKWTCVARGGHLEAIVFGPLLLLLLDRGLQDDRRLPWVAAGLVSGFAVYFSYLAAPLVLVLWAGALAERRNAGGLPIRVGLLLAGAVVGFLPWIVGLVWIDMPYLEATIHQSGNPNEAAEVHARTTLDALRAALAGLPHNLWPWTVASADAPAYLSDASDMLDYTPGALEWIVRGVIVGGCVLGLLAAFARRSWLMVAVAVVPAAHYLFVVRLANPLAWPDVPHRYLVLVFPFVVATIGSGVHHLASGDDPRRRRTAGLLAAMLVFVGLHGLVLHAGWMRAPDREALASWDVVTFHRTGLGQVRVDEGEALVSMVQHYRYTMDWSNEATRGIALVYPPMADYYLLFRADDERPYRAGMFSEQDAGLPDDETRETMVRAAFDASALRYPDREQLHDMVCGWEPCDEFDEVVARVFAEHGVDCSGRRPE
jgi:hypothetical protein